MCYVYILQCSDNTLYTGWTNNVKLVYFEKYDDKISAQKREFEIKQLSRLKKLELIKNKKF